MTAVIIKFVKRCPKPLEVVSAVEGLNKEVWIFAGNIQRIWLAMWGIK